MEAAPAAEAAADGLPRSLIDALPALVAHLDHLGRYQYANKAYSAVLGLEPESLRGRHIREVFGSKRFASIAPHLERALAGRVSRFVAAWRDKNGKQLFHDIQFIPERARDGRVQGLFALIHDRTQALMLSRELKREGSALTDIVRSLPALVWEARRPPQGGDSEICYVSPYAEALSGYSAERWCRAPNLWLEILHPEDRARMTRERAKARRNGQGSYEYRLIDADGRTVWVHAETRVMYDENGRPVGTRGVAVDITARKEAEASLIESERAQREFVANVSHDFRTPIAVIKGFAETLVRGGLDDKRHRLKFTRAILRNAERLALLVEDVLLASRVESGALAGVPEPVCLREFAAAHCDDLAPGLRKSRKELQLDIPAGLRVRADRGQLVKVLQNLIGNASRYNRPGGWIRLRACVDRGKALVSVKDNGLGIASEHLPRVFERFYRVDKTRSAKSGETGLGLHIVKQLIEASGNRVWANSKPGKGSTFYFTLDLA